MNAYEMIANHQLVLETFGRWPSFHDGEVHRVVLDRMRRLPNGAFYPCVELFIRGWIMTEGGDGYFKLEHDSVIHFLFEEVFDLRLEDLNHQNVVWSLEFKILKEIESAVLSVELKHCFGLCGGFKARRSSVVSVTPWDCEASGGS